MEKRLHAVGTRGYGEYLSYLDAHPDEYVELFNTILINVTSFFRDPGAWAALTAEVVPEVAAQGKPIRAWSAGCASGEEAYTLAMLLAEQIGPNDFGERVKIYATDVDERALASGRAAVYTVKDLEPVPPALRKKYFHVSDGRCAITPELRRAVIFGRHDLIQDPPIPRLDLLVCRNTLMYFDAQTQKQILPRFHYALADSGFLFLGKAEMLFAHRHLFEAKNLRQRIFSKVASLPSGAGQWPNPATAAPKPQSRPSLPVSPQRTLLELALEEAPLATLVIDEAGTVASANRHCRKLFGLGPRDVGRALHDLELSYRPVELRSRIEQARAERKPNSTKAELRFNDGSSKGLIVHVAPIVGDRDKPIGATIVFEDVTEIIRLQGDLAQSNQQLETALEELQSSNEELETTNEELQSSNEELETANEELQSSNEELETMNEELQSTNEELDTTNREMHERTSRLSEAKAYLESILANLQVGVVVLGPQLNVDVWNDRCVDLWGMRTEEVLGKSFFSLDIGFPADELRAALRACLGDQTPGSPLLFSATNRRGKPVQCRVLCAPLRGARRDVQGVIVLMEEWKNEDVRLPRNAKHRGRSVGGGGKP